MMKRSVRGSLVSTLVMSTCLVFAAPFVPRQARAADTGEVLVKGGTYTPFFREKNEEPTTEVASLYVDRDPVTNAEFRAFLVTHPKWRKSNVPTVFAGNGYLSQWKNDLEFDPKIARQPVANVSWFAARAYCRTVNKRLMTVAEWEYVSDSQAPENLQVILNWYGEPSRELKDVSKGSVNKNGLRGMHGLIWEWVEDFSSVIVAGDSRDSNDTKGAQFCGAGSLGAKDPTQYATFMRYAHRSSLQATYVGSSLGFRCARSAK